jgi:beta-lactam-binding protein with PASTA domain
MISLKEFFSFKSNRFFWLNLIAMVAVVIASIFGVLEWLDSYTRHGESILVPNVKGLPLQQAKEEMIQKDLEVLVVDSNYVKEMPAGSVLEQNPDGDSKVKKGRTVYLIINTNSIPKVTIPDIIDNSSYRQAEARLRALGFKMTEPELIEGEKDWVYAVEYNVQNLSAGDKIPRESVLTLRIGAGEDGLENDSIQASLPANQPKDDKPTIDKSWF